MLKEIRHSFLVNTPARHNNMNTRRIFCWSHFCCQHTAGLWRHGLEPWRCAVVSGINTSVSRSFRFCKQKGVVPAYPTDAQLDWYFELVLFKPYLNRIYFPVGCVILLEQTPAIWGCCFHEQVYRVYNGALGGGTSQSSIHLYGRTQGFLAEHCPKTPSASTGFFSSHSASWCHVFPRLATPMHQVIHVMYVPIVGNSSGGQEPTCPLPCLVCLCAASYPTS